MNNSEPVWVTPQEDSPANQMPPEIVSLESEPQGHLRRRVLSGSAIMLLSSVFVSGVNLIYNVAIARALGADDFGHASVVYTLLMILSSVTLAFQLICSKYVARSSSSRDTAAIYRLLHRRSWLAGMAFGLVLALLSSAITRYLNLPSKNLILTLALGVVFYVPLGVRRGFMQGTYDFWPLAINFALEVIAKLVGTVILMAAGQGVEGVVTATSASVLVAYICGIPRRHHASDIAPATLAEGVGEGVQAVTFFVGQVIISNLDVVLVKHFFDPTQAGLYAAIALVGRLVYMLSWSIVSGMFPFSAGIHSEGKGGRVVLSTALLLVIGVGVVSSVGAWLAPPTLWRLLLGAGFPIITNDFSALMAYYAAMTAIYCVSVVLMSYEISRKIGNVAWVQLGFSALIILAVYLFHDGLHEVISVQFVLKLLLLLAVSVPFLRFSSLVKPSHAGSVVSSQLHRVRRVEENEVIAEFLKGEFYQEEFRRYRQSFGRLVYRPDLNDARENALRRALLFQRRGRLWRELPADTEWWEIQLSPRDFSRVRVFARNQWLRYGAPGFLLLDTVEKVRGRIRSQSRDAFILKLRSLSLEMEEQNQELQHSSVLLITINEFAPLTILEGNHRMTAAGLVQPGTLDRRFRYFCGFSAHMSDCCWYRTDISTLWRYGLNTIAYYLLDRHKVSTTILEAEALAGEVK
ncbi:MAG: oligosaccharide flippase family protein, partial [Acidobacteria bacterium]|nr:oligosaccharide flippase family protein [Acidobacteriota bacterium]